MRNILLLLTALTPLLTPTPTHAITFAEPSAETLYYYPYVHESLGTLFQVGDQDIQVSRLGLWDQNGDGLNLSYDLALFCWCNETPLAQTTIPSGTTAPLEDGSRWVNINPVQLQAGGYYVIAAYRPDAGEVYDPFTWLYTNEISWGEGITPLDDLYSVSDSLILPTGDEECDSIIGANFQYNIVSTPDSGSTLALLALALCITRLRSPKSNAPSAPHMS
jgi:hypothetical protein